MRTSIVTSAVAAAVVLAAGTSLRASVVYQETFGYYDGGTNGAGQTPYFGYDWDSQAIVGGNLTSIGSNTGTNNGAISFGGANGNHNGSQGPHITTPSTIGTPSQTASAGPIYYTAAQAANRNATNDAVGIKYGVGYNNFNDTTVLDYTKEYAVYTSGDALNTTNHPGLTFSWFEGNNDANGGYSLAVEVGNQWYVTSTTYKNQSVAANGSGTSGFVNGAYENNVAYTSSVLWNKLNFNGDYTFEANTQGAGDGNPGTATTDTLSTNGLSRDTVDGTFTLDTTQNIQAFGLFSDSNTSSSNRRFDSFTITDSLTAAPEPTSLALLGMGAAAVMARRRKA